MLKKIALVLAVLVIAVLGYATTRPDTFAVQRTATIAAPPERIFPYIQDFHQWNAWSPYDKLDPAMQRTYGGAANGVGATYAWTGNSQVGQGRMEVTDATAPSHVAIKLDFLKPFESHNVAEFTLQPAAGGTQVTWAMHGPAPYVTKLMGVFVNMDKMIGKDFETGLANLKTLVERAPGTPPAAGAL